MANFQTHISASTLLGIAYGTVAYTQFGVSAGHSCVSAGLCAVAGMLPDLDHKLGVPLREMLCFVSLMVPMLMLRRFEEMGLSPEQMVFVSGVLYVLIRFVGGELFRKFTVHRGMWHSIPAAVLAGMVTYLICLSPENEIRLMKSWAVVLGFMLHLLLDELYSVDLMNRRIKKSSGTAMKFVGKKAGPNLLVYANIIIIAGFIASDGMLMDCCRAAGGKAQQHVHEGGLRLSDGLNQVFNQFEGQAKEWVGEAFEPQFSQESQNPMVR
jgi:membrane-bound metal-dependent hydrolase YbcI (DUF457 family)